MQSACAAPAHENAIWQGDCLTVLSALPAGCASLCYIDPPYLTGRDFGAFDDRWHSPPEAQHNGSGSDTEDEVRLFQAVEISAGAEAAHYLAHMHRRLGAIKRALSDDGTIFVHVDGRMAHYLRHSLDLLFGADRFLNQIVWHYGLGGFRVSGRLPRKHDIIMWYAKSDSHTFNPQRGAVTPAMRARYRLQDEHGYYFVQNGKRHYQQGGKPWDDVWEIPTLAQTSRERTGYPTQKPVELLSRIIKMASNEGDLVLDAFCGSGTTLVAAKALGRKYLGIDIGEDACLSAESRIQRVDSEGIQAELALFDEGSVGAPPIPIWPNSMIPFAEVP